MNDLKIAIQTRAADPEAMADLLENIAAQIRDGMTSGYYPHWSLDGDEEEAGGRCGAPGPGEILGPCALPSGHGGTLHVGINGIAWEPEAEADAADGKG